MKPLLTAVFALAISLSFHAPAFAMKDPDLEGPVRKIDIGKNTMTIQNVLTDSKVKNKEKKVYVKQGMIGQFKMGDYVQVRMMADNVEAKMIEKTKPSKK